MPRAFDPVTRKEINNQPQGRTGGDTPKKMGPAVGKVRTNPTRSGGINRATSRGNAPRG